MVRKWRLGIDLGGTNLKIALVNEDGRVEARDSAPTRVDRGPDHVLDQMAEAARDMIARAPGDVEVVCLGVGCPGPLDSNEGVVYEAPNLGWEDVPARQGLEDRLSLPVALNNDANCAAWGEYWAGAGRGASTLIVLTLGTGIGGGVVIDGRLFKGACDAAGEFGHITIDYDSPFPYTINRGGLEHHASATALARLAREAVEAGEQTALRDVVERGDAPTAKDVFDAAEAGDALSVRLFDNIGTWLGVGVANLVNAFNPERVIFTGGMAAAWSRLEGPLRTELARRSFRRSVAATTIRLGELWEDAGLIGAAGVGYIDLRERGKIGNDDE